MKKITIKTLSMLLIFASVFMVMLAGCGEDDANDDENSTIAEMSKGEAKEFFLKAYEDTVNANYFTVAVSGKTVQAMEAEGETQEYSQEADVKISAGKDVDGVMSILVLNTEGGESYDEFFRGNVRYVRRNGSVMKNDASYDYSVESVLNNYMIYTSDMEKAIDAVFAMSSKLSYHKNTVTVKVKSTDFEEFATCVLGEEEGSSVIEESKEMLNDFSVSIECTADDKNHLVKYSFALDMNVTSDGQTMSTEIRVDMDFADVNGDGTVSEPDWVTEFLSNPENFADRFERDEFGNIIRYEVDTHENGILVKTVIYNADGSISVTVEYERNEYGDIVSRIVRSSDGTVIEKEVNEYNAAGVMIKHTVYQDDLLSLVKTWDLDTGLVVTTQYENGEIVTVHEISEYEYYEKTTTYKNGKPASSETRSDKGYFTTEYYYKLSGELFCYADYSSSGYPTFYDTEGNVININEIDNYTYIYTEKDASGKVLFDAEYNYYKLVTTVFYDYDDSGKLASARKVDVDGNLLWKETYADGVCVLKEIYTASFLTDIYEYNEKGVCIKHTINAVDGQKYIKEYSSETGKLEKEYSYYVSGDYYLSHYDEKELKIKEEFWTAEGKRSSYTLFQYNEDGKISRQEKYNANDELYQYSIHEYFGEDGWKCTYYYADGTVIGTDSSENYGSGG